MIALGCDHGGYELMQEVKKHLTKRGFEYKDCGCYGLEAVDYPEYGRAAAEAVVSGECEKGILICGTGIGISMAANKVNGARAACCSEPYSAKLSRQHNNSNILCFGARVVGDELAKMMVDEWLTAEFLGDRHERRINIFKDIEARQK